MTNKKKRQNLLTFLHQNIFTIILRRFYIYFRYQTTDDRPKRHSRNFLIYVWWWWWWWEIQFRLCNFFSECFSCQIRIDLNHNSAEMNLYWPNMSKILLWMAPTVWDFFALMSVMFLLPLHFSLFLKLQAISCCVIRDNIVTVVYRKNETNDAFCLFLLLLLLNTAKQGFKRRLTRIIFSQVNEKLIWLRFDLTLV